MIRRVKKKRLKRIKRIPKIQKFKFEDESHVLNSKINFIKSCYILILILSFVVGNYFIINPTIQKANLIEADYNQKKQFLLTGDELKSSLIKKNKKIEKKYLIIKKNFFKKEEQEKFYKIFSELAMNNKLKILTLNKISENFYKEAKKDNPTEFNIFDQYTQVSYDLEIIGNFLDYMNFVDDLKKTNKSLITNNLKINKGGDGMIKINSNILINFKNT